MPAKKASKTRTTPLVHTLVPKHEKLTEKQAQKVLKEYNCTKLQLPKINTSDPAVQHLTPKAGDIIKITRNSATAGTAVYYRVIIDG